LLGREVERRAQERNGGKESEEAHGLIVIGDARIVKARLMRKRTRKPKMEM
jgi:hypothetical protein